MLADTRAASLSLASTTQRARHVTRQLVPGICSLTDLCVAAAVRLHRL
jgi:hypothetical protein